LQPLPIRVIIMTGYGDPEEDELAPLAKRKRMQSLKSRRRRGLSRQSRREIDPCGVLSVMRSVERFIRIVSK